MRQGKVMRITDHDRPLEVTWVVGSESALQGRSQPARNLNCQKIIAVKGTECRKDGHQ